MFKLVISDDEGKQTVVPLVRDEITVGRKEGNTIRLTERNVSRRHARIVKANGKFVLEDLQSYNGVKVNGQRIGAEVALDPGDQIAIGDYQIALQVDATDATVPEQMSPAVANADTAMIAAPGPPARLVMITPPAPGAEFALTSDRVRIGRAEDLDVWVNHRSISREHAEIQKEPGGGLRLIDLGSANGVRVNNQDVQNAVLSPGDVVELGQVRFRFVAAGEHYAFDADRTVQMDAVSVEPSGSNRAPLLVALAIVLLAVIGAVAVAVFGGDDETVTVTQVDEPAGGEDTAAADPSDRYQAALTACESAVADNNLDEAMAQARIALEARPGDRAATQCQSRAQSSQADLATFDRGVRHFDMGQLREAYDAFDSLPEDSPLRSRDEVRRAIRSYANERLREGETAMADQPERALEIAQFVLMMAGLTPDQMQRANELQRQAQDRGAQAPEDGVEVVAAANPQRRGGRRGGGRTRPPRNTGGGGSTQQQSAATQAGGGSTGGGTGGGGSSGGSSDTSAGSRGPSVDEQARQCSMIGDNPCVIRLLEGRARTPQQLGLLIEAYRARGQTNQAVEHMRTYVQRYSGTPRARSYQQILARQ